jgi:hypothetical protein
MKQHRPAPGATRATSSPAGGARRKAGARAGRPDGGDVREQMVREAAYYHYEARGRVDGHEVEDWLQAEAEIERRLAGGQLDPARH